MTIHIHFDFHIRIGKDERHADSTGIAAEQPKDSAADFATLAAEEIERQTALRSQSTLDNYLTALRSYSRFQQEQAEHQATLDADVVGRYERWLRNHLVSPNTISCYMRSLRALAVKVCGEGAKRFFRSVYTGYAKTDKRAVGEAELSKLKSLSLPPGSFLALARDLFLFSFYALGMPFVDMARLRRSQIGEGQIVYHRHKTGLRITVPLMPCMQEIIDRYASRQGDYVFPILASARPEVVEATCRQQLNHYNRALKTLEKRAAISRHLTSYVARHTWASMAYSANVDLPVISKALGHTNSQHTLIYIKEINDNRVGDANDLILNKIKSAKNNH